MLLTNAECWINGSFKKAVDVVKKPSSVVTFTKQQSEWTFVFFMAVIRAKSTSSTKHGWHQNSYLWTHWLANSTTEGHRQPTVTSWLWFSVLLNRLIRAVFLYDEPNLPLPPLFSRRLPARCRRWMFRCSCSSSTCTSRKRPNRHVRMT